MIGMTALLAGMGQGYLDGKRRQRDEDRQDERDHQQREEAEARREERDRVKSERNRVADAYAPVTMQSVMSRPETADNRDVGTPGTELVNTGAKRVGQQTFGPDQAKEAEAAVTAANLPEAQTARASQAMLSMGDMVGAEKVRTGARAEKLGELQLRQAIEKSRDEGNNRARQMVLASRSPQEIMAAYNASGEVKLVDLKYEPTEVNHPVLGKVPSAKLVGTTADGRTFEEPDVQSSLFNAFQLEKRFEMLSSAKRQADDAAAKKPLTDSQVNENNARADALRGKTAAAGVPVDAPIWDDKADAFLRERYTVKDPTTGGVAVDGGGLQFGKTLALGRAAQMGGDTTSALGYAFEQDARLRALATDTKKGYDQARHAVLRKEYLATVMPKAATGGGIQAATTRPATAMETIQQDMAATGVKEADVNVGGMTGRVSTDGKPATRQPPGLLARMADLVTGPRGAPTPGVGPAAPMPPDTPEAAKLDAARVQLAQAHAALMKFGSTQRAANPMAYVTAQHQYEQAKAETMAAEAAYQRTTTAQGGAAFGITARP